MNVLNLNQNKMENEFIPYPLALRLKAIGFDEPCLAYFDAEKLFKFPGTTMCNRNFLDLLTVTTPLYQQAFRWFREKYDLGHMINGIGHESFIMNIAGVLHIFNAFAFKTYEEAELACLEKLIELVEQKEK